MISKDNENNLKINTEYKARDEFKSVSIHFKMYMF